PLRRGGRGYARVRRTCSPPPHRLRDQRAPEVPHETGAPVSVAHHVVEGGEETFYLRLPDRQGRQQFDHVDVVAGDLGQDAVTLEQRHHHHLREQSLAGRLQ